MVNRAEHYLKNCTAALKILMKSVIKIFLMGYRFRV